MSKLISLWEKNKVPFYNQNYHCGVNENASTLTPYLLEDGKAHGAIIVFPGGGYTHRSEKEGEPVAVYLNSLGFHTFVLNYRVMPYHPYLGCVDGKRAVKYLRANAAEIGISADCIGVIGFSAGAGNACLVAETFDKEDYYTTDRIDTFSAKPNFCILSYGPLSLKPEFMSESDRKIFEEVVPQESREEYLKTYSCDELVRKEMPPMFIWHAADDIRVNAGSSIAFVQKLQEMGNSYEFHIFPNGGHGCAIAQASQTEGICQWIGLAEDWMRREGFLRERYSLNRDL